jgi:cytoskeleton protein RodZ
MLAAGHEHGQGAARVARGAGALLRQAREAKGISPEELAARTRLELRVISALEADDYASLVAAAFVRGYIRSVARELEVDPAPILAQYEAHTHFEDPALADFSTRSPAQITSSSALMRGISAAIAVVVVALVALWWHRNYQSDSQSADALAKLAAETSVRPPADPGTPLPYTYTVVDHSSAPLGPVNSWRHQTDGSAPPPATDATTADQSAGTARDAPATGAARGDGRNPAPTPHKPAPPAETEANPTAAAASPPVAAASGTGELVLRGRGESWVEISDFAGKRLYFGMLKSGQTVAVSGKPPYDLVIGNSSAVSLSFRGDPVDVRARAVNGVARFSLGELR